MSSREPSAESRDRNLRRIRTLTVATGSAAVGATVLIGGLAAGASVHSEHAAANAALTDSAFVASRFRVVQHRMHV